MEKEGWYFTTTTKKKEQEEERRASHWMIQEIIAQIFVHIKNNSH